MQPWVELGKTYFPWTSLMCTTATAVDVNPVMVVVWYVVAVVASPISILAGIPPSSKANKNRLA